MLPKHGFEANQHNTCDSLQFPGPVQEKIQRVLPLLVKIAKLGIISRCNHSSRPCRTAECEPPSAVRVGTAAQQLLISSAQDTIIGAARLNNSIRQHRQTPLRPSDRQCSENVFIYFGICLEFPRKLRLHLALGRRSAASLFHHCCYLCHLCGDVDVRVTTWAEALLQRLVRRVHQDMYAESNPLGSGNVLVMRQQLPA